MLQTVEFYKLTKYELANKCNSDLEKNNEKSDAETEKDINEKTDLKNFLESCSSTTSEKQNRDLGTFTNLKEFNRFRLSLYSLSHSNACYNPPDFI